MNIAILITVFNRKETTLKCLRSLNVLEQENHYEVFVVDGGSSDGTIDAIHAYDSEINVSVHPGLFWAGGMIQAWKDALASDKAFDYYMLINDDTVLLPGCLKSLLDAEKYYPCGIYVGATCDSDTHEYTYGGLRLKRQDSMNADVVMPSDFPQLIDMGNANIMLVPKGSFEVLGFFSELYTHGIADYDYTLRAVRKGMPVVLASGWCGECKNDHGDNWMPQTSSLRDRIHYLYSPKGLAYKEYLIWVRRFFPKQYLPAVLKLWLKTLFPILWEKCKHHK